MSLEHAGPEKWAVVETITPSAINSWIGEEVKVGAAEASASTAIGAGRLSATTALFGLNDTAGTLLAFRGWALHDVKATAFGLLPLPALNSFMQRAQAADTRPVIELDDRPGFYAKLAWAGPGLRVQALHYDNRGDPEVVTATRQWGWRTRFDSLGATLDLDAATRLTAQAMNGRTEMGFQREGRIWVDTRFRSAFLLATRTLGAGSVSGRIEAFGTRARGSVLASDEGEDGWAATLAARRRFGAHATVLAEVLHIDSNRPSRARNGLDPRQRQTLLQLALRLRY